MPNSGHDSGVPPSPYWSTWGLSGTSWRTSILPLFARTYEPLLPSNEELDSSLEDLSASSWDRDLSLNSLSSSASVSSSSGPSDASASIPADALVLRRASSVSSESPKLMTLAASPPSIPVPTRIPHNTSSHASSASSLSSNSSVESDTPLILLHPPPSPPTPCPARKVFKSCLSRSSPRQPRTVSFGKAITTVYEPPERDQVDEQDKFEDIPLDPAFASVYTNAASRSDPPSPSVYVLPAPPRRSQRDMAERAPAYVPSSPPRASPLTRRHTPLPGDGVSPSSLQRLALLLESAQSLRQGRQLANLPDEEFLVAVYSLAGAALAGTAERALWALAVRVFDTVHATMSGRERSELSDAGVGVEPMADATRLLNIALGDERMRPTFAAIAAALAST